MNMTSDDNSPIKRLVRKHEVTRGRQDYSSTGFILPLLLITGIFIVMMIVAVSSASLANKNVASHNHFAVEAQMAADAGLDSSINQLNTGGTGVIAETPLLDSLSQNIKTTYEVTVTDVDSIHKTLTVTARVYFPEAASTPKITRKYLMDVEAVTSKSFTSSVASGVGGLTLNSNAKITGGDVVVDGTITMNNNSQIGLSTNPVNVRAVDDVCPIPPDSSYPQPCPAGSPDSIQMGGKAVIYGNVQANNLSTAYDSQMFNPGHVSGSPTYFNLPSFDRSSFKSTITTTMSNTDAENCVGNVVSWPAGVHITGGDVVTPNNCTVEINGNVWIDGSLTLRNNAQLAVQDGVGSTMPNIVVDGSGGVIISYNGTVTPNSSGTGVEIVTFWNTTGTSCTPNPADCTSVTGTDLYNSQNTTTISLKNNGSAPASVLYAYWSRAEISNNGNLGAVAGQTVELDENAIINFTSSITGSNNKTTTWVKRGYMRLYN